MARRSDELWARLEEQWGLLPEHYSRVMEAWDVALSELGGIRRHMPIRVVRDGAEFYPRFQFIPTSTGRVLHMPGATFVTTS